MKMYVKRIKNIPFTIIHYILLLAMVHYIVWIHRLKAHNDKWHASDDLEIPDTIIGDLIFFIILGAVLYCFKTVIGYLFSFFFIWLSNNMISDGSFDAYCTICMPADYIETGNHYLTKPIEASMISMYTAAALFFLAFALVTIRLIVNKVKNRGLEPVDKKENEIVNPELRREGSDFESSGYLD